MQTETPFMFLCTKQIYHASGRVIRWINRRDTCDTWTEVRP